jgi:hypothetical protein
MRFSSTESGLGLRGCAIYYHWSLAFISKSCSSNKESSYKVFSVAKA